MLSGLGRPMRPSISVASSPAWRRESAIERTALWRPDLLDAADLTPEERERARAIARGEGGE